MPSASYTTFLPVSGADILAADHVTHKTDIQAEFNTRLNAIVQPFVSSGFTTTINATAVDVASGEAYDGNGKRYAAAGSVTFSGADANGSWKIYVKASDETYAKTQAALAAGDVYLADVTWTNPTLSALTDKRLTRAIAASNFDAAVAPTATTQRGTMSIGGAGFTGGAGHFAGSASGTSLAIHEVTGYAGNLIDVQLAAAARLVLTAAGNLGLGQSAPAQAIDVKRTGLNDVFLLLDTGTAACGILFDKLTAHKWAMVNERDTPAYGLATSNDFGIYNYNLARAVISIVNATTSVGINTNAPVAGAGLTIAPPARTSGSPALLTITAPADTTLTLSAEATDVNLNLARTVQFATGALTTQRAVRVQAPTYAFVAASTITTAATVSISGAPIAGTNATITNAYALWLQGGITRFDGNLSLGDAVDVVLGTTTGTKIGTAATQKLGFFNAAPVVQQASAANLTNNVTAGGVDDTIANFTDLVTYATDAAAIRNDIYQLARKLKQVNDALRLYGLLS